MIKYFDSVLRQTGGPYPDVVVTVLLFPSEALAPIYTDDGSGLIAGSTVTTDARGFFEFFCDPGRYILEFGVDNAIQRTIVNVDVGGIQVLEDLADDSVDEGAALIAASQSVAYAAGTLGAHYNEQPSVKDAPFLATGDGVTDDTTAIKSAIENRPAGSSLLVPPGDYLIVGQLDTTLTSPLELVLAAGARLVGNASAVPMLTIRGGTSRYRLIVRGGQIDNGDRTYVPGSQSGTALNPIDIDDLLVDGVIIGRKTRDWSDNFGDSGITPTQCLRGAINNCIFYGQPDLGIYITGGSSTGTSDDYGDFTVTNNKFYRCQTGASVKRQSNRLVATGNLFYECYVGIDALEASGVAPGRVGTIGDNIFKFTQNSAIRLHGAGGWAMTGNVIEDFGFDRSIVSGVAQAIWLRGASDCVGAGNIIRFVDWVSDVNHSAIILEQYNDGVTTFTPANNHLSNTLIKDVYGGIRESASVGQNFYPSNTIINATTPISITNAASFAQFNDGTSAIRCFIGSTEMSRLDANSVFVRGLRTLDSSTVASVPANFTADRYYAVNFNGTVAYIPAKDTVW